MIKFTLTRNNISRDLQKKSRELKTVPEKTWKFWVSKTPRDTGRARRSTVLRGDVIEARYPYAQRLDQGWSRQARDGMSKPTEQYFKTLIKRIMRKI